MKNNTDELFPIKAIFRGKIQKSFSDKEDHLTVKSPQIKKRLIVQRSIIGSLLLVHAQLDETNFPNYI